METRKQKLLREEIATREPSQIHKTKQASEKQSHPFRKNRRKDGLPSGVFRIERRPPAARLTFRAAAPTTLE